MRIGSWSRYDQDEIVKEKNIVKNIILLGILKGCMFLYDFWDMLSHKLPSVDHAYMIFSWEKADFSRNSNYEFLLENI